MEKKTKAPVLEVKEHLIRIVDSDSLIKFLVYHYGSTEEDAEDMVYAWGAEPLDVVPASEATESYVKLSQEAVANWLKGDWYEDSLDFVMQDLAMRGLIESGEYIID